mgnify:CR=1 FL=1
MGNIPAVTDAEFEAGRVHTALLNDRIDAWTASVADLYGKGISTGSMSKAYALAGLRLGWIFAREAVMTPIITAHQYIVADSLRLFQRAIARTGASNVTARTVCRSICGRPKGFCSVMLET